MNVPFYVPSFYAQPVYVQLTYGAPLLVLQGTFDGTISLIGGDFTNTNTFVFDDTNSPNTESVSVEFTTQTLPEPTAGILILTGTGLLGRMLGRNRKQFRRRGTLDVRP